MRSRMGQDRLRGVGDSEAESNERDAAEKLYGGLSWLVAYLRESLLALALANAMICGMNSSTRSHCPM